MKTVTAIFAVLCLAACSYSVWKEVANCDYFPLWNGTRALLHGVDPYSPQVTAQNRAHATEAGLANLRDEERVAYPLFATVPLLPLGLLPYFVADGTVFVLFTIIIVLSVGWVRGKWDSTTALYCVLSLATYPVLYGLRLRQPTILFLGLAIAGYILARSGKLVSSGVLVALAFGKPQLALAFAVPMVIWTLADWSKRGRFVWSLGLTFAVLAAGTTIAQPRWWWEWLDAVRHYTTYVNPPLLTDLFGARIATVLISVMAVSLLAVLWWRRDRDLLEQLSISIVVFQWITPFGLYNPSALLIPWYWLLSRSPASGLQQLTRAAVQVALIELWLIGGVGVVLATRFTVVLLVCLTAAVTVEYFYKPLGELHTSPTVHEANSLPS